MEHRTEEGVPVLRLWCTIATQLNTGIHNNATINCITRMEVAKNPKRKGNKVHGIVLR